MKKQNTNTPSTDRFDISYRTDFAKKDPEMPDARVLMAVGCPQMLYRVASWIRDTAGCTISMVVEDGIAHFFAPSKYLESVLKLTNDDALEKECYAEKWSDRSVYDHSWFQRLTLVRDDLDFANDALAGSVFPLEDLQQYLDANPVSLSLIQKDLRQRLANCRVNGWHLRVPKHDFVAYGGNSNYGGRPFTIIEHCATGNTVVMWEVDYADAIMTYMKQQDLKENDPWQVAVIFERD